MLLEIINFLMATRDGSVFSAHVLTGSLSMMEDITLYPFHPSYYGLNI